MALPAHETKHISSLFYPFRDITFHLSQRNDGASNGTGLWLGSQILSAYLADVLPPSQPTNTLSGSSESNFHLRSWVPPDGTAESLNPERVPDQPPPGPRRRRAIELGSGIGLSSLVLASLGWDVLATDIQPVVDAVLRPNVKINAHILHSGSVQVRELDWTVPPESWIWDDHEMVASHTIAVSPEIPQGNKEEIEVDDARMPQNSENANRASSPYFDLIVTADTLYSSALITPLLRTLHNLCITPKNADIGRQSKTPLIYLALENRDPALVFSFFKAAKTDWNFTPTQIPTRKIQKALERSNLKWKRCDWEGVEIWKLAVSQSHKTKP